MDLILTFKKKKPIFGKLGGRALLRVILEREREREGKKERKREIKRFI